MKIKSILHSLFAALATFALTASITGCTADQEQAFLSNAPAVLNGTLATATDLYAAYAAANQQLNGKPLSVATGIPAAQAAAGSLQTSNIKDSVTNVFNGLNALATSLKTANPAITPAQIVQAQSAQLVAAQVATKAAAPSGPSTAKIKVRYSRALRAFVLTSVVTPSE